MGETINYPLEVLYRKILNNKSVTYKEYNDNFTPLEI
uniref:Uncharacterized protein n=1 Tax=viral metagenome TaxID=1070528 RepID=A0A6C0EBT3_9ZZZZ